MYLITVAHKRESFKTYDYTSFITKDTPIGALLTIKKYFFDSARLVHSEKLNFEVEYNELNKQVDIVNLDNFKFH